MSDNDGIKLYGAVFPEMHLVPMAPYNIISITQRMESGWRLARNKEQGIVLERDGFKMCFDIRMELRREFSGPDV
jgi:hypothetical protein